MSIATKLGRMITYLDELLAIKAHEPLMRDHMINKNHYILNTIVLMATKLARMVTYLKWLPTIKILDLLVTWFC